MADQDIMHTAEIMKAALPYIDAPNKVMLEFAMKIIELMGYVKTLRSSLGLAACGYQAGKTDMEGMLNNIRPVCNKKERDIIDKILNIFNMKRAYEMYSKMMDAMNIMQGMEGFPFGSAADTATDAPDADLSSYNTDTDYSISDYASDIPDNSEADITENSFDAGSDDVKPETASSGSAGMFNDKMLEMLKAMVPPEQKATFDNLSMLLSTMSYDNTSKPDESKEQESNG
jgi:hypothetical protein